MSALFIYYGLVVLTTAFFWIADTATARLDRRWRGLVGGLILLTLPAIWRWPVESWIGAMVTPTVGHFVASSWGWLFVKTWIESVIETKADISDQEVLHSYTRVVGRIFLVALPYTVYVGLVSDGYAWVRPALGFIMVYGVAVGLGLRLRGNRKPSSIGIVIAREATAALFIIGPILVLGIFACWATFVAGFYDLFRGIAALDQRQVVKSILHIIVGWYLGMNVAILCQLDRISRARPIPST
jgi:hypothetical protein